MTTKTSTNRIPAATSAWTPTQFAQAVAAEAAATSLAATIAEAIASDMCSDTHAVAEAGDQFLIEALDRVTALKRMFGEKLAERPAERRKRIMQALNRYTGRVNVGVRVTYQTKDKPTEVEVGTADIHPKAREVWEKTPDGRAEKARREADKARERAASEDTQDGYATAARRERAAAAGRAQNKAQPQSQPIDPRRVSPQDIVGRMVAMGSGLDRENLADAINRLQEVLQQMPVPAAKPTRKGKGNRAATAH